jgi:CubicO group peptidase (beta-lactamase class C family)
MQLASSGTSAFYSCKDRTNRDVDRIRIMKGHHYHRCQETFAVLALSAWLLLDSGLCRAQTYGSGPIVPELAPLESAMTNYLASHQFKAGTMALMYGGRLVLRQGYGWRDTNFTRVIHPDNLFRLASVSKMLTESAIYKLVDAGKIAPDTLVYAYLGIPPWGGVLGDSRISSITVQNLLDHKGGWDNAISPVGDPVFSTVRISVEMGLNYPAAATNVISWMFSKPLDHAPGTTYAYSNLGYQILGRVIEKASGKPYIDYIQQDLLGTAAITNTLGFTNVIQSRSRPSDLAPWEIWYGEPTPYWVRSAVDFPANLTVRDVDGGLYYESFDSFGGVSASAIGLCHYLLNYWEGGHVRPTGGNYSWNFTFFGSLPGATAVLYQNISQTAVATNGLEFAALFNERTGATPGEDNSEALTALLGASSNITSWPATGGGMIQWAVSTTNVNKNAGSITVPLLRSGESTLPVKVSYTTYALTATDANYVSTSGIVNFAAGVTSNNITVPILNDFVVDSPRQFSLELISASGGAWLGDRLTSVVTILDTNTPPVFTRQPAILSSGAFQFQTLSSTGLSLTVQYSTNLSDWQLLQQFTAAATVTTITDTNAARRLKSFYRVVVP